MRDIKFRGKRVDNGEWVYGFYWASLDPHSVETKWRAHFIHDGVSIKEMVEVTPESVGQYTGLKDKNGVEIYEGDVVQFHYFYQGLGEGMGVEERENEIVGEIFMSTYGWALKDIVGKHWENHTGYDPKEGEATFIDLMQFSEGAIHEESFEVIGNIHQNPELLK